jgi:predicted nucleic acid-binding protein
MPLVVDASVAVKWVIPEPDSDLALRMILRDDLVAPDLLRLEVGSALWKLAQRGKISLERVQSCWDVFNGVPVALQQASGLVEAALDLAIRHEITVYDGTYLALALALGCPVVTADRRLLEVGAARTLEGRILRLEDVG